jgi:hypothetical protein
MQSAQDSGVADSLEEREPENSRKAYRRDLAAASAVGLRSQRLARSFQWLTTRNRESASS